MTKKKDVECFKRTAETGKTYVTCKDKKTGEQLRKKMPAKAAAVAKPKKKIKLIKPKAPVKPKAKAVAKPKAPVKPKAPAKVPSLKGVKPTVKMELDEFKKKKIKVGSRVSYEGSGKSGRGQDYTVKEIYLDPEKTTNTAGNVFQRGIILLKDGSSTGKANARVPSQNWYLLDHSGFAAQEKNKGFKADQYKT